MIVELSPVYLALCGLVQDALHHPNDATLLLQRAAKELANVTAGDEMPDDLEDSHIEALQRAGIAA